jgi:hypothetical protein
MLGGFADFEGITEEAKVPSEIGVFGTYVSEGYGKATTVNVGHWITAKSN